MDFDTFVDKLTGGGVSEDVYEVSKVVGQRDVAGGHGEQLLEFKIRWAGSQKKTRKSSVMRRC